MNKKNNATTFSPPFRFNHPVKQHFFKKYEQYILVPLFVQVRVQVLQNVFLAKFIENCKSIQQSTDDYFAHFAILLCALVIISNSSSGRIKMKKKGLNCFTQFRYLFTTNLNTKTLLYVYHYFLITLT